MRYIWQLKYPDVFIIFILFLVIYGVFYRVIIPIISRNRQIQGFSLSQNVYLIRFLSSLLFFFIIFLILKFVLNTNPEKYGIRLSFPLSALILYIIILPILIKYSIYRGKRLQNSHFSIKSINLNWLGISKIVISWLFYITGYEILYRGIILYSLVPILGKWEAIAVVTSIYFFDHISRDYYEAIGAFLIGFVFGYIVLINNSVLESIILHYLIAITTDIIILSISKQGKA